MRFALPALFFSMLCSTLYGQKLEPDSNYVLNSTPFSKSIVSNFSSNTFIGYAPFYPFMVRKLPIGHPEGAIGIGLTQQYQLNPHPYRWQNERFMQPLFGVPQYPDFVLREVSPTLSRFSNQKSMMAFSSGQLDGQGFNPQFRQVKFVQGISFKR